MKTNTLRKEPRTVEVKLLVPYAIIAVMAVAIAGLVTGWMLKTNDMNRVQAEAHNMVTSLAESKERSR